VKTAYEDSFFGIMLAVFTRIEPALRKSISFHNDTTFAQHTKGRDHRAPACAGKRS
jgi:hypothetical protein